MSRIATLAASFGVGSLHVGLQHTDKANRAVFQFVSGNPFNARLYATQDFDFFTNTGSNWIDVTDRAKETSEQDADFVLVNGNYQRKKDNALGLPIDSDGVYAFGDGFLPAAFMVSVTTVTSGSPLKILFGV